MILLLEQSFLALQEWASNITSSLNISLRSGTWWDNFMNEVNPGPRVDDINKALSEHNAELVMTSEGEQLLFQNEEDKVMFLLRYS